MSLKCCLKSGEIHELINGDVDDIISSNVKILKSKDSIVDICINGDINNMKDITLCNDNEEDIFVPIVSENSYNNGNLIKSNNIQLYENVPNNLPLEETARHGKNNSFKAKKCNQYSAERTTRRNRKGVHWAEESELLEYYYFECDDTRQELFANNSDEDDEIPLANIAARFFRKLSSPNGKIISRCRPKPHFRSQSEINYYESSSDDSDDEDEIPLARLCNRTTDKVNEDNQIIEENSIINNSTESESTDCESSNDEDEKPLSKLSTDTSEIKQRCKGCNKFFSMNSTLSISTAKNNYKCKYCKNNLLKAVSKKHLPLNNTENKNICHICKKSFMKYNALFNHLKIHGKGKKFVCEICNKSYGKSSHLKRHTLIHTESQSFPCRFCEETFTSYNFLKKHALSHVTTKKLKCKNCDEIFKSKYHFKKHLLWCIQ